ncbi:MAG: patatin-like phospholipase family protein [Prolixibacteraceae bacterium]|nr:patatin-like phospholipase family protein [Prolixibacteraceae bacterium]MBN2650398.1 patatin-like phospholipase family protein [Prolixibacteraceae bacterium]
MMKKVCILSIDGGGIRGILPGVILSCIEERLRLKAGDEVRLSDYFDLVAGTSTGGILTCLYLTPNEDRRPKFEAKDAVDLYFKNGGEIFSMPFYRKILNPFGLFESKYPATNIEKVLKKYFNNTALNELLKPCIVTAYDFSTRRTYFFNQKDPQKGEDRNFLVRDIARATSAAPTYFPPVEIHSFANKKLCLIDGGVFAGNPAMCAYAEARTSVYNKGETASSKPDFPTAADLLVVSLGTGLRENAYSYRKARRWGLPGWLRPIIDILMSGSSETVHYQMKQLFNAASGNDGFYFRLEPQLGDANSSLDDASEKNMNALKRAGEQFVRENSDLLDRIVDLLIENK